MSSQAEPAKPDKRLSPQDPTSYARPDLAKVTDIHLDLAIDFKRQVLEGAVVLTVDKVDASATHLLLDTRALDVSKVTDDSDGKELDFKVHPEGFVGSKMEITLPSSNKTILQIKIAYATTKDCTALQWLSSSQTAGKQHPYLFSQCQAIHARSMLPCQDTPSVKASYSAAISAPAELTVVMSGVPQGQPEANKNINGHKVHRFLQKIPIQSYLIAIAAGDIVSKKIGPRSHVWSEKEYVDKAAYDFEDTEIMLQKAEQLCGPYVWGIYDILVLPPSFPYGGMENPCLTFATPTLLAGDKSLAGVVAHEIAHSWSGNLVTNKNFEHFWLNEGFTVFIERKIGGIMFGGEPYRGFSAIEGWDSLAYQIEVLGAKNPLTNLVVDLNGVDPDDAFSSVPYEKGSTFLWYLEDLVGGPSAFEPFLRTYFDKYKYESIDSYEFKRFFLEYFKDKDTSSIDWDSWFFKPGMPIYKPKFDESLAKGCKDLKAKWVDWNGEEPCPMTSNDMKDFTAGQKMEFLSLMISEEPQPISKLEKMDQLYELNAVNNSEIKFRWIRLGLKAKWNDAVPRAVQMVTEQGRMKFLRPIYRDLYAWEEMRETAIQAFKKNRGSMMHVAIQGLEADLHLD